MRRDTARGRTIRRTTVDLDMTELAAAKQTLGTHTTRDTIDGALRQVNRRARLARAAALVAGGGLDLVAPEELAALRRVEG